MSNHDFCPDCWFWHDLDKPCVQPEVSSSMGSERLMADRANKPSRTTGAVVCSVCERELRSESSIANGIGPVCAARQGGGY